MNIKRIRVISSLLLWRMRKNISYRTFLLMLSFIVGLLSGLAAVTLKNTVHYIGHLLTHGFDSSSVNYIFVAYPLAGILLTVLFVKYFVKDNIGHGISKILFAISKKNSIIKRHNSYSSMVASSLTVGFGGSVGLEAPIVLTGSSIGSNLGRYLKLNYKDTTLLIACGAAGAIAGIFKAPIAALVFALEILMLDLTMWSLVPLLISSVTGTTLSLILSGKGFVFSVESEGYFSLQNLPYYAMLGVLCGLVSVYFTRIVMRVEAVMDKVQSVTKKLILGGIALGLIIFLLPPLYGEGYGALTSILNGRSYELGHSSVFFKVVDNFWYFAIFLFLILIFKAIATALTTGSGGVGGIFAPTLFMGGVTGAFFTHVFNHFSNRTISEKNFALAGMAGVMAGVMHAPLTAIFLIAEITGGYQLFVPLMVTATISYLTVNRFEGHSIYTHRLAQRGHLITHDKDRAILTRLDIDRVIETDLKTVKPNSSLRELVKVISNSKRNIFPVTDNEQHLIGVILLDNIRDIIFNTEMYDKAKVENLMESPPTLIFYGEGMETVIDKFETTNSWNLPVIKDGKYYGFISKSKLFSVYRKRLKDITDD
jgi:chloride channel protein, CIC family